MASGSPRRRELLSRIVSDFEVDAPALDEDAASTGCDAAPEAAVRLAEAKARAVGHRHRNALIIGADTLVVLDGRALGKPRDDSDAREMILALGGRVHEVVTGVAVLDTDAEEAEEAIRTAVERTLVRFRPLDEELARAYIAHGESLDKAGAYGIQGMGSLLVEGIEGCYYNVVGLPLHRLGRLLEEAGVKPMNL